MYMLLLFFTTSGGEMEVNKGSLIIKIAMP
jgi:hypothetical protein